VLPKGYEIHVRGQVPSDVLDELEHLTVVDEPAVTVLTGVCPTSPRSSAFSLGYRISDLNSSSCDDSETCERPERDGVSYKNRRQGTRGPERSVRAGRPRRRGHAAPQYGHCRARWASRSC
jgi:hypothetical protein